MFSIKDVIQLQPSETVELVERRSLRSVAGPLLLAAALISLPFFFLFSLIRAGGAGAIVFCLLLASGITAALRVFVIWDSQVLIVTSRRVVIVLQKGVWKRKVEETALPDVQDAAALLDGHQFPDPAFLANKIQSLKNGQQGGFRLKTL